jgi:Glycosyltransferases involved in cell wall biogenesis
MQNTSLCSVVSIAPQISVIMAVRNCAPYLAESIDSILNQTFEDFEFIIVDDSSTDATPQILADYAARDARIRILRNEQNLKLAASLNIALRVVRAPLIARMDGDDWSYPERLEKQYAFMKTNSQVTVCGTWLACYETGELWKRPIAHSDISAQMLFNSSIVHPSVMIYRDTLKNIGGYDETMPLAQDYDLWARLALCSDTQFANIPQVLLRYRVYPELDRSSYNARQAHVANMIRCKLLHRLGLLPTDEQLRYHRILGGVEAPRGVQDIIACLAWKGALLDANKNAQFCGQDALEGLLSNVMPRMLWRMVREFLARAWRSVAPQCVRKIYYHLRIVLHKVL